MLSSCINWVQSSVGNVKSIRRYFRSNNKNIGAATHEFKLLKAKYLDNQAFEKDDDDDSDTDDDNNIMLNPENDPEIK